MSLYWYVIIFTLVQLDDLISRVLKSVFTVFYWYSLDVEDLYSMSHRRNSRGIELVTVSRVCPGIRNRSKTRLSFRKSLSSTPVFPLSTISPATAQGRVPGPFQDPVFLFKQQNTLDIPVFSLKMFFMEYVLLFWDDKNCRKLCSTRIIASRESLIALNLTFILF